MNANITLDEDLFEEATRIGGHPNREAAVTAALEEYVQRHKRLEVVKLFGTIDYDPDYDYKAERQKDGR